MRGACPVQRVHDSSSRHLVTRLWEEGSGIVSCNKQGPILLQVCACMPASLRKQNCTGTRT